MNHALLRARLGASKGQTILREAFHRAPLKIAKSFGRSDGGLDICVMDCSPGLLQGDRSEQEWHLESGARAHIFNQGFTRVHPCGPASTCGSALSQSITLEAGAGVVLRPEPIMLFAGARLFSHTRVAMAPSSTCVLCEIVCAGRVERGEAFAFRSWRSVLEVERAGELVFVSRQKCEPGGLHPGNAAAWNGYTHWAQVLAACDELGSTRRDELLQQWRAILDASECWGGASLTVGFGASASLLGRSAWEMQAVARQLIEAFEAWRAQAFSAQNSG